MIQDQIIEFFLNKEQIFEEIQVLHRKIRVDNTSAVNMHNKIYVPTEDVLEIISIQARFISPGGKITEVPKEGIRKLENYENKGNYMTFAIEGAEPGGQI